ncbi:aldehyde dehydrogenase family protein [Cribrihabitans pelagius]|uniref:aldehyde dehydrogenase family protein n=1 Tax=Cribrihabitans pelagius TaxID=1765746 RepID=UPI003B59BDAD
MAAITKERTSGRGGKGGAVTYQPTGVICLIQPWDFPLRRPARVLAADLIAGNGCTLKPAGTCTGSDLQLRGLCIEPGLPVDLVQVILIGHDVSDMLMGHSKVRGVTMTGSDAADRHIDATAAKALIKTVLELGSKDAYPVPEDGGFETAVKYSVTGRLYNNGETCVPAKCLIVTDMAYDAFTAAFVDQRQEIRMGDPMKKDSQPGPLSSQEQFGTVKKLVEKSAGLGAKMLCGDEVPTGGGANYPAAVLAGLKPGMPACDDQMLGTVVSTIRAKDDADAMRLANESRCGLGAGIFPQDGQRALELGRRHLGTGMIRVNSFGAADPNMPLGGVKDSGCGREPGGFGMRNS